MIHICFLFLALVAILCLFFFLGKIILRKISTATSYSFTQLFLSTLTGLSLFTILTAIYFTKGSSIFSVLLILILALLYLSRKNKSLKQDLIEPLNLKRLEPANLLPLLPILLFLFYWFGSQVLNQNFELHLPANPENILYAQFAKIISASGVESTFGIGFLPTTFPKEVSPYHYFDLWFTAGISSVLHISELEAIHFFTLPSFNFLNVLGVCALFEKFTSIKFYHSFIAVLFLFVTGCYFFPFAEAFGKYEFDYLEPVLGLYGEKLSFAFTSFLLIVLLFLSAKKLPSLLFLLLIPMLFPALLFSIYLAVPLFCMYAYFKKIISSAEFKTVLIFQFIVLLFISIFYLLPTTSTIALNNATDYSGFTLGSFKMLVVELFYRAWDKPFRSALMYLPFILLLFLSKRKTQTNTDLKSILVLSICIYFTALFSWGILYKMPEAWQLYTNVFVLLHITLILLFIDSISQKSNIYRSIISKLVLFILLTAACIFTIKDYTQTQYKYSETFLQKIKAIPFPEKEKFVVAYIKNAEEYISHSEYYTGGLLGAYLQLEKQYYGMVNIGFYELLKNPNTSDEVKERMQNQNFYAFVEQEKNENKFETIEISQLNFLIKNNIHYLVASRQAIIPDLILKRTSSIFEDQGSGEKFLILKNLTSFK